MFLISLSRLALEYRNNRLLLDATFTTYTNWNYETDGSSTKHLPKLINRYSSILASIEEAYSDYSVEVDYLDTGSDNLIRILQYIANLPDKNIPMDLMTDSSTRIPISLEVLNQIYSQGELLYRLDNATQVDDKVIIE